MDSFFNELFTRIKIPLEHELVVQTRQHGMFQSDPGLLLQ